MAWIWSEIDESTIGPIVIGSTKWPSPQSKWKILAPACSSTSICSARCPKSAAYSDGSTSTVRTHSRQGIGGSYEAFRRAMKNPDVPCRSGRVSRNSGSFGWANCGHSSPSGSISSPEASTTASFSSALIVQTE